MMFTHTVFFWLKPETTADQRLEFEASLRTLFKIPGATRTVIGKPAVTASRPVVDHSYDYALELDFPNIAAHDDYQNHSDHLQFVAINRDLWTRVEVRDFEHI